MKHLSFLLVAVSLALNSCTNVTVQAPQAPQAAQASEATNKTVTKALPKTVSPPVGNAPQVSSQPDRACNYAAGTAVGGQAINVDLCSIQVKSPESIAFVYYLNNEQVKSEANCSNATWITFPERQVNRPQSSATQNMLDTVCSRHSASGATSNAGAAIVFDPPSNVRVSPNGEILCAVQKKTTINIYGSNGAWYKTDVCGSLGFIHGDQLKF